MESEKRKMKNTLWPSVSSSFFLGVTFFCPLKVSQRKAQRGKEVKKEK